MLLGIRLGNAGDVSPSWFCLDWSRTKLGDGGDNGAGRNEIYSNYCSFSLESY